MARPGAPRPPAGGAAAPPASAAPPVPTGADPLASAAGLGPAGVRRLSREEPAQTIQGLAGVSVRDKLELLPADPTSTPFDNDYREQLPSAALLEGTKALADTAAARVLADPVARERLVGCRPAGPGDQACLRQFIARFGRRALRRPLAPDEVDGYAAAAGPLAVEARDFHAAVEVIVRAMLQDVELLYRIELGTPVAGAPDLLRLGGFEVATRLSYLLWGSGPNDALLDLAERGGLATPASVRSAATQLMADPRAAARLRRLHALWLGYEEIAAPDTLAQALRRESDALVDRVVGDPDGDWLELFRTRETFVDRALAAHYGLPAPTGATGWVPQSPPSRQGILGHGAVLANGQKFGKTSVVQRGLFVLTRLACRPMPEPPPDLDVDVDAEPKGAGPCKADNLRAHATAPACAGCHRTLDGAGLGLEAYDLGGRFRTRDETGCAVDGVGELHLDGTAAPFAGPAALSARLVESGTLDACFVEQLYTFAVGRPPGAEDAAAVAALQGRFRQGRQRLRALLIELVSTNAFLHRKGERS